MLPDKSILKSAETKYDYIDRFQGTLSDNKNIQGL